MSSAYTWQSAQPRSPSVRFAHWVFLLAGIVGLLEIVPLYFYESTLNRSQPPPITHPDFYYGFVGIALAWQVAFLIISRDPMRYRPLAPVLFLEKLLYPCAIFALYMQGRVRPQMLDASMLDLVWLVLFVASWLKLRPET
jgi:hypothetical protein